MDINYSKIYDISIPISYDMPVYKGKDEKRPILKTVSDYTTAKIYESKVEMNLHTGTHLDRTLHMIPGGNTIDTLKLSQVITPCRVIDLSEAADNITADNLKDKNINAGEFVLLKTKNSYESRLETEFIYLEKTGAKYLVEQAVKGVGIDALGIERNQPEHETHLQLMTAAIHILEGICLKYVEEGEYLLFAVPINIVGAEAAPVRAILLK